MQARAAVSSLPLPITLASLQLPKEVLRPLDGIKELVHGNVIRRVLAGMLDEGERTIRVVEK